MKRKIKIKVDIPEEPPPFFCCLCESVKGYWLLLHDGESKLCASHWAQPIIPHKDMRGLNFKDSNQICAASLIIKELKNAAKH